jgi:nucleoid-associated protein YgaU
VSAPLQPGELTTEGAEAVPCLLDPARSSIGRTGAGPREVALAVVVDATLLPGGLTVRRLANLLVQSTGGGPARSRVTVRSKTIAVARAVCSSARVTFTAFGASGEPARADIVLMLAEPTGGGGEASLLADRGVHVVMEGENLPAIAHAVYGDATRWRDIADASGIDDPLAVRPGAALTLPSMEP